MISEHTLDCRGLTEAIAVLRIKQALHCATEDDPRFHVQISANCCPSALQSGLGSDASCVSRTEIH
ncbi:MAG: hypothetical protein ACPGNV_08690 [Mangrovicoccus sp.]